MHNVHWILQQNLTKASVLEAMKAAIVAEGASYELVTVVPFSEELPEIHGPKVGAVVYGSTTMILNAYASAEWRHAVFYSPEAFCFSNYLLHWGRAMLNADAKVLPLAELTGGVLPAEERYFLRPDADSKAFAGGVFTGEEIQRLAMGVGDGDNPHLGPGTMVVVAEPKSIVREWRCVAVNGLLVTVTRYMLHGELAVNETDLPMEMLDFAEAALEVYQPHAVFVLDIAETAAGYGILECNCFNGTGFYGNGIGRVVRAVSGYVGRSPV